MFWRFPKYIYIENHPATECHREVERCQILVCLPFPCRRKGIQHEPRGPGAQNEFINNSASVARTTPRACGHSPGAPASRGAHSASYPLSRLSPPFLKVAPSLNLVFAFPFLGRPRAGARLFLYKLETWLRPEPIRASLLDFPGLQSFSTAPGAGTQPWTRSLFSSHPGAGTLHWSPEKRVMGLGTESRVHLETPWGRTSPTELQRQRLGLPFFQGHLLYRQCFARPAAARGGRSAIPDLSLIGHQGLF